MYFGFFRSWSPSVYVYPCRVVLPCKCCIQRVFGTETNVGSRVRLYTVGGEMWEGVVSRVTLGIDGFGLMSSVSSLTNRNGFQPLVGS